MHLLGRLAAAAALVAASAAGTAPASAESLRCVFSSKACAKALTAFRSEAELRRYIARLPKRPPPPPPPPPSPPPAAAPGQPAAAVTVGAATSITNNQVIGVDEGDIVKQHGDTLVILRRGRLFSVSLANGAMRTISTINAYPPGVDASGDWYDEMLISGDRIVVIGYSYNRGGTQVNRFRIAADGRITFEDAYQVRSNDYYSSRNYASRLIGTKLVLYSPLYLPYSYSEKSAFDSLPGLRKWTGDAKGAFRRVGSARHIYLPPNLRSDMIEAIHSVMSCDVTDPDFRCTATSVFGPAGRTFYVSMNAVYVWLSPYWGEDGPGKRANSLLYRLPLDGSAPSAIGVAGGPVDQFSFREDGDGILNVLVRANSAGDAMWTSEYVFGATALLRLPLTAFGDGLESAPRDDYRALPTPKSDFYSFNNRFVGDYVLYGSGNGWGGPKDANSVLTVAPLRGGESVQIKLPHAVDRIEVMGSDAVIVGSDASNVYFSTIDLSAKPAAGDRYALNGAAQSETRSHGFFFKPEGRGDGVIGLPIGRTAQPGAAQLSTGAAAIVYVRRKGGKLSPLGELGSNPGGQAADSCAASCTDWYGNARPIFIGDRSFALMGYELVEGRLEPSAIRESGRVNFAPQAAPARAP